MNAKDLAHQAFGNPDQSSDATIPSIKESPPTNNITKLEASGNEYFSMPNALSSNAFILKASETGQKLSASAILLYLYFSSNCDRKSGRTHNKLTKAEIATLLNTNVRQIGYDFTELVQKRFIRKSYLPPQPLNCVLLI